MVTSFNALLVDQLLAQAEQCARSTDNDGLYWEIIGAPHHRSAPQIFDIAVEWCKSPESCWRALGAAVLSQLGCTEHDSPYPAVTKCRELKERQNFIMMILGVGYG